MDSCDDYGEIPFKKERCWAYLEDLKSVSGVHRAVSEGDLQKLKRLIEKGESVNKQEYHCLFSLLHMAVIKNNLEVLEYLVTHEDIELNLTCFKGKTPLNAAVVFGNTECIEKLIEHNADVNKPDHQGKSPLHTSVYHPDICHLLIRNGAKIDAVDRWNTTVLLDAVQYSREEVVHMLLYYNADANLSNIDGKCPFMASIRSNNFHLQEVLLEYVDDFNRFRKNSVYVTTLLMEALQGNSPFVRDMIERGADVNYVGNSDFGKVYSVFAACLLQPVDLDTFKIVWNKLRYNEFENTIDLCDLFKYFIDSKSIETFLQVIIDSDNFEPALRFFCKTDNYFSFVNEFAERKLALEQLMQLTCRLLECGFRATSHDIHIIFLHYGYCELLKILMYMDNDFMRGWPHHAVLRLIFDIGYDLKSAVAEIYDIPSEDLLQSLEYSICPQLVSDLALRYGEGEYVTKILASLPKVPSLIDLACNATREYIRTAFKTVNACQFYTIIDHLDIPRIYKSILKFEKKIYRIQL